MPVPQRPDLYRPKRQLLSVITYALLLIVGLALLYTSRFYVAIGLVGVGLGVLFVPVVDFLTRRARVPRGPAAVIVLAVILGAATGLSVAIVNLISGQVELLIERAPAIYETLQSKGESAGRKFPWLEEQFANLNLAKAAQTAVQAIVGGLRAGVSAAGWMLIILLIALYVSANSARYFRGLLAMFPAYQRPEVSSVLGECARVLRKWFKGQLLVMLTTGIITTIGLRIIGVEYWLLFGAITVALSFIPFVGSIISTAIATLVTMGSDPEKALWVLGLFIVIQQIEGNVTIPLVMRGTVELPEVHLLVLVIIMTSWLGLIGALIAAPIMAVVRTALMMTYVKHMDQRTVPPDLAQAEIERKTA